MRASHERRRYGLGSIIALVLILALLAACGVCAWDRWLRFDDAADIQGVWHDANGAQVAVDEARLLLGDKVIYDYTIDTIAKTIHYSFEDSQGEASYRFNSERNVLVLQEQAGTDWLVALHLKSDPALESAEALPEGCTRLERQPGYAKDVFDTFTNIKHSTTEMPRLSDSRDNASAADADDSDDVLEGDMQVESEDPAGVAEDVSADSTYPEDELEASYNDAYEYGDDDVAYEYEESEAW